MQNRIQKFDNPAQEGRIKCSNSLIAAQETDQVSSKPLGNPAVVGLAGFGLTTLMLQFHNLGWVGIAPVIWLGFIFGGLAQMIAGFQEQKMGNNFGYAAFCSYGAFWISLCAYLLGSTSGIKMLALNENDLGFLLFGWNSPEHRPVDRLDQGLQGDVHLLHPAGRRLYRP